MRPIEERSSSHASNQRGGCSQCLYIMFRSHCHMTKGKNLTSATLPVHMTQVYNTLSRGDRYFYMRDELKATSPCNRFKIYRLPVAYVLHD